MIFGWFSGRNVRRLHSPRHCLRRCGIGHAAAGVFRFAPALRRFRKRIFLLSDTCSGFFEPKISPEAGQVCIFHRPIGGSDRFIIHEFPPRCNRLHHIFRIALPAARTPGRAKTPTGQKSRGIPSLHHWGRGSAPAVEGVRLLLLAKRKRRVAVKNRTEGIKISYCDRDCLTYVLRIKCVDYLCI